MGVITRRKFAGVLGLAAAGGILSAGCAPTAEVQPIPAPGVDRAVAKPEEIWKELMDGNKRFVAGKTLSRDVVAARAKTGSEQHPYVAMLCCSDSRLSPELIFDQNIGDLFVVRTAGNIADPIAAGSMEYAVEHLGSRMLVVMGHERCGAVSATLAGGTMPTQNLTALVDKMQPGIDPVKGQVKDDTLIAVEANVHHSAAEIIKDSPIIAHQVASGKLTLVTAVYDLDTGEVRRLAGKPSAAEATKATPH
jgi:carbonic anhydrase